MPLHLHDSDDPPVAAGPAALSRARQHPRCFVCSAANPYGLRLVFCLDDSGATTAEFSFDARHEGYPGVVHGGIAACVLDGAMTNCLFRQGISAYTADLQVRYRHPLLVNCPAVVTARITRSSSPLFVLSADITQDGQVRTTATGKFLQRPGVSPGERTLP